jgi:uncharacterized protein YdaU (DUF1376 family)
MSTKQTDEDAKVWMPLFIGDYLADTARLTTEQHGAYFLIIMDYWRNGPPPDDDTTLAQIARLSMDAWSMSQAKLRLLFSIDNGVWRHKRIDQELVKAKANKAQAKVKATKAANARWGKQPENAPSDAPSTPQAVLKECPSPSPSPLTKEKQESLGASAPKQAEIETGDEVGEGGDGDGEPTPKAAKQSDIEFERAWSLYPKRHGGNSRQEALKAWNARIRDGVKADIMVAGTERYAEHCKANDKLGTEFVMQASRFYGSSAQYAENWPATPNGARVRGGDRRSINDISKPGDASDDIFNQFRREL